jgi:hypothetical protein
MIFYKILKFNEFSGILNWENILGHWRKNAQTVDGSKN